ncbi:MAG: methyltransferase domain-containing protein [Patescibacteria group bacterium]|jgi:SAM-dependent methyltransferase
MSNFFEGEDFKNFPFKALIPEYYPLEYQEYIRQETKLLKEKVRSAKRVLEAGVGIGRLIPEIAPLVSEFMGVDTARLMLEESIKIADNFSNVKIENVDLKNLNKFFSKKYFDFSLCVWNTLGNVEDEVMVLKELNKVTEKSIVITTYLKGTLENRKNWYKAVDIKIRHIDEKNEIFYSQSGLKSKAYSSEDVERLAYESGLKIIDSKILNRVMLWTELKASK